MTTAPETIEPVTRFSDDLESLELLFSPDVPPRHVVRSQHLFTCIYRFVDASGAGFGSSLLLPNGTVAFRQGIWGRDVEASTSNYRELRNLVETIEEGCESGSLLGSELFIFTDNTSAEGAYYRGNSPSQTLFGLVRRLRLIDMHGQVILHVMHVAGT